MAVTKILARKGPPADGINYILNSEKTDSQSLTAYLNCDPGHVARQMMDTKVACGKTDSIQYYHLIQSFKPGEVTPDLALKIAKEFVEEQLPGFETVIAVHVDKSHIHAHLIFNSVNADTGKKYHSNSKSYYTQLRANSDRLCKKYGLSIVTENECKKAISYIEWLRQSRDQPTFRSMLEEDLRTAIKDANDLGHFFLIMEHKGWEIKYGNRLGFRLRGQERFMIPGRKNLMFTEDGILCAIQKNLSAIETVQHFPTASQTHYRPYKKYPKYTGFMALYVHYLYVLGKVKKHQCPQRMTSQLKKEVMRFERYREQFTFLRKNKIAASEDMAAFQIRTEEALSCLVKQRTILNVQKKKRRKIYSALADIDALAEAKKLYDEGLSGMKEEASRYREAAEILETCGIPKEHLTAEKAELYAQLAELNRFIRAERRRLALCQEIQERVPKMEKTIEKLERRGVVKDEYRRR